LDHFDGPIQALNINQSAEATMDVSGRIEGADVLVVELREDNLDASNVREFRDMALTLMQDRSRIVLDLAGVKFIDSSGLGALISCLRQVNGRQGDLRICNMSATVRALFELMRMHRVFNIHNNRAEAVASFG
jgi:anti-sigma B factor antagonist